MADPGGPPDAWTVTSCSACERSVATWPARFCHWCGASLGVDVVELDEPAPTEVADQPKAGSRIGVALAIAGMAALVGLVVFTGGDADEEPDQAIGESTARPTPTARPTDVDTAPAPEPAATAAPLAWEGGAIVTTGHPVLVRRLGDEWLVLANTDDQHDPVTGVRASVSTDGLQWTDLGNVIPEIRSIHAVGDGDGAVLVAGEDTTGAVAVWLSDDARTWERVVLPANGGASTTDISAVAVVDDALVVATNSGDLDLREVLIERFPELDGLDQFGYSTHGAPFTVTVDGPLGLPLLTATADDLGVDENEARALFVGDDDTVEMWVRSPGEAWETSDLEALRVNSIVADVDGDILAGGWVAQRGPQLWASSNGVEWERADGVFRPGPSIQQVTQWNDTVVGVDVQGRLQRRVGNTWELMHLGDHITATDWFPVTVAGGEAGLAVVVQEFPSGVVEPQRSGSRAILVENGVTLTADLGEGSLTITDRDGRLAFETRVFEGRSQPGVVADLGANVIRFSDPETGVPIAAFDLDDLASLERALFDDDRLSQLRHIIAVTTDGATWSTRLAGRIAGADATIAQVAVGQATVLAIAQEEGAIFGGPPGELVAWVAPLGDR